MNPSIKTFIEQARSWIVWFLVIMATLAVLAMSFKIIGLGSIQVGSASLPFPKAAGSPIDVLYFVGAVYLLRK